MPGWIVLAAQRLEAALRFGWLATLIAAGWAVSMAPTAYGAETGQIRLGDDYAQFHIGGTDWKPCEHECATDVSCKSWTYITSMGQCRLKHSVPAAMANTCCVSGVKEAVETAKGDEAECARFADEAISANDQNLRARCGLTGPLWSSAYETVYGQCLDSSPRRRARENDERHQALQVCKQTADLSGQLVCDHYARMAVAENITNTQNNCGFDGPAWNADYQQHVHFCREAERSTISDQIAGRERQLLECLSRGGGRTDHDCDTYASQSVSQFAEAGRSRCGDQFSGPGWSADAGEHYRWCRTHGREERDAMLQHRQEALDGCGQIRIDLNKIFNFKF